MNTLRAFQGTDTALSVTLNPAAVDFAGSPALVGEIHRGDGRGPVATVTPTWVSTINDKVAVPMPGTVTAAIPPGNYVLSVRVADESAYLSWDALVVYPGTADAAPIRSLIPPSECLGVIPEIKGDLGQLDGLTWLLEAATVACESYCDMALAISDVDRLAFALGRGTISLAGKPIYDFEARTNPDPSTWGDISQYTEALDRSDDYDLDEGRGEVSFRHRHSTIFVGRHTPRRVRLTYRAGYAIDPHDVFLGVEPVPKDLQSACLMVAIAIRESAKTAGPTTQQGQTGMYYTKSATETSVPAPARAILDRYSRQWGVA